MRKLIFYIILIVFGNDLNAQNKVPVLESKILSILDSIITVNSLEINTSFESLNSKLCAYYDKVEVLPQSVIPVVNELYNINSRLLDSANNLLHYRTIHYINLLSINLLIKAENKIGSNYKIDSLIQQIVVRDIKNYYKLGLGSSIFATIKQHHFYNQVVDAMRDLLYNPYMSLKEAQMRAEVYVINRYSVKDTIGYWQMKQSIEQEKSKYDSSRILLSQKKMSIEEFREFREKYEYKKEMTDRVSGWIQNAEKANMRLDKWLDSIQYLENKSQRDYSVDQYLKMKVGYYACYYIGLNYVTDLAPDLEKLSDDIGYRAELALARMQYDNYEKKVIERIKKDMNDVNKKREFFDCIKDLTYINSQESYYTIVPTLINKKNISDYVYASYDLPVRWVVFTQLKKYILNLPIDEEKLEKYDDTLLEQIYEWMIKNKGHYKIIDRNLWTPIDGWSY